MADQPLLQPYVIIDGVKASMVKADMLAGLPTVTDGLQFDWGRDTIANQPDPQSVSFTLRQRLGLSGQSIFDACKTGRTVQIWATGSTEYGVADRLVWAGEISTAKVQPTDPYALEAQVTCIDASVVLGNITIGGDAPWPEESAYARFQRIVSEAGLRVSTLRPASVDAWWTLTANMDPTIRQPLVAYREANPDTALSLFQALADTLGAVAWITADVSGRYLWLEDPTRRQGLRQFKTDPITHKVTIGQLPLTVAGVNVWAASDIAPADPLWAQDPSQSVNLVDINWQQPDGVDDQGIPQYIAETMEISDSTVKSGIRSMSKDTDLVDDADVRMLAAHWLAQGQTADWVVSGLRVDTGRLLRHPLEDIPSRVAKTADLLDCKTRIGYRITVTGLPSWSPSGTEQSFYIEGGSYTWSAGRWQLQLTASSNALGGGAKFNSFPPGTKMTDFAGLKGSDMWGVAAPNLVPAAIGASLPMRIVKD